MSSIQPDQWVYVAAPIFAYCIVVLGLAAAGWESSGWRNESGRNPVSASFRAVSASLERYTGLPGWSMAGALTGLTASGIAVLGLYWDVAWHIDNGRDNELFTPSHTMILIGLNGLVFAAAIAVIFATLHRSEAGIGFGSLQVPWSALVMGALGIGAVVAFPLDDLWHRTYGVDVTLWSPTHLQLIAGGSLGPMAIWLMIREGRRSVDASPSMLGRGIEVVTLGAILTGLSTFQGEFDFGVPQFQALYHPLLIVAAGAIALVAARLALGAGGAVLATVTFLVLRSLLALLVGGALNHTVPRFPLYIVAALVVEAAASGLGTDRRLRFSAAAGVGVATAGLGAELAWVELSGWGPVSTNGLAVAIALAVVVGVAGALLGSALGSAADERTDDAGRFVHLRPGVLGAAGLALIVAMALPLPRTVGDVDAVITLDRIGDEANVAIQLTPTDAADDAALFGLVSWQGGGRVSSELEKVGPGRYQSVRAVPVTGRWKSMVGLQRGDQVMAAPIYLPADPEIGAAAVPALAERRVAFGRNTDILLREAKAGPAGAALAAYAGVAVVSALWVTILVLAVTRVRRSTPAPPPPPPVVPTARPGGWVPRHVSA